MNEKKITIGTFDLIKGMTMIFIVVAHMRYYYVFPDTIFLKIWGCVINGIGAGLMPLLFMISGYRFKSKKINYYVKKTAKDFLVPYFAVMLILSVCFPIFRFPIIRDWNIVFKEDIRYILAFIFGISCPGKKIFGIELYDCSVVWFLASLFVAQNVLNIIIKIKKELTRACVIIICVILGYFCAIKGFWYFCIPQGLMAVGYIYIGYCIREYKVMKTNVHWSIYCVMGIAIIYEMFFGGFGLAYNYFKNGIVEYFAAASVGLILFKIAIWTDSVENRSADCLRKVGRYTYLIMCIHGVEMVAIPWYHRANNYVDNPLIGFLTEILLKIIVIGGACIVCNKILCIYMKKKVEKMYE